MTPRDAKLQSGLVEKAFCRLLTRLSPDTQAPEIQKWSTRTRLLFENRGKPWDDGVEAQVKALVAGAVVAGAVVAAPSDALEAQCEPIFDSLIDALVEKLDLR